MMKALLFLSTLIPVAFCTPEAQDDRKAAEKKPVSSLANLWRSKHHRLAAGWLPDADVPWEDRVSCEFQRKKVVTYDGTCSQRAEYVIVDLGWQPDGGPGVWRTYTCKTTGPYDLTDSNSKECEKKMKDEPVVPICTSCIYHPADSSSDSSSDSDSDSATTSAATSATTSAPTSAPHTCTVENEEEYTEAGKCKQDPFGVFCYTSDLQHYGTSKTCELNIPTPPAQPDVDEEGTKEE